MVVPARTSFLQLILPLALLLMAGACTDVPLDTATYFSDTLSVPLIDRNDTIPARFESTLPVIPWKTIEFAYLSKTDAGDPRRQRMDTVRFVATEAKAEVNLVQDGNRQAEIASIDLHCRLPRRVRDLSIAEETGEPTRMAQLEISIPKVEIIPATSNSERVRIQSKPGNPGLKPSASITIEFRDDPPKTVQTGEQGDGYFQIKHIDRRRRIMYATASLRFEIIALGKPQRIPLFLEMAISY